MQTDLAPAQRRRLTERARSRNGGPTPFLKFLIVGAIAYVITQAGLALFYDLLPILPAKDTHANLILFTHPDIRLLIASALAVEMAIVFKFYANEHWTFIDRKRRGWFGARLAAFNAGSLASAAVTIGAVNVLTPVFGLSPYITNTIGTLLGFLVNYVISAYIIWPLKHHAEAAGR